MTYSESEGSAQLSMTVSIPMEVGVPDTQEELTNSPSAKFEVVQLEKAVSDPIVLLFPDTQVEVTNSTYCGDEHVIITVSDPTELVVPGTQAEVTNSPSFGTVQLAKEV